MRKTISYILISLVLIASTGCAGASPDTAVKSFMEAMIKADFTTAAKYISGDVNELINAPEAEEADQLVKAIFTKLSYQLGENKVTGNTATVEAKITAPDLATITAKVLLEVMPTLFSLAFSGGGSEEQAETLIMESFQKHIDDKEAPMLTTDVTIHLEKADKNWIIKADDAFINALTGSLEKAWAELGDQ